MGLVSFVLTLPLAPMRSVISLARVLEQRANEELYDPARVRRRLEEIEEALASGSMGREEAERAQKRVLEPVVAPVLPGAFAEAGSDSGAGREPEPGGGTEPEATGDDFVTVRSDDESDDRDAAGNSRDVTGNDFVTLRGDDSDPTPET